MRTEKDTFGIFFDFSNIVAALREITKDSDRQSKYDIVKITNYVAEMLDGAELYRFIYLPVTDENVKFISFLKHCGFETITKNFKTIFKKDKKNNKADFDVEITMDIMDLFYQRNLPDILVLFSGDSDFAPLLLRLKSEMEIKINVVSSHKSLSRELSEIADKIFFLEELVGNDCDRLLKTA